MEMYCGSAAVQGKHKRKRKFLNLIISRMEKGMELGFELLEPGLTNLDNHHCFYVYLYFKFDFNVINVIVYLFIL